MNASLPFYLLVDDALREAEERECVERSEHLLSERLKQKERIPDPDVRGGAVQPITDYCLPAAAGRN